MILQQQLPNLFDVAFRSRLRVATISVVVLSIFPPFMKLSIPAKNRIALVIHLDRLQEQFQQFLLQFYWL
jgi:hypothetical protein